MYPRLAHFGPITIPTYGVLAAVGLIVSILLAEWCAPRADVAKNKVYALCIATAFGTLVLSRLVLVLQSPQAFRTYPMLLLSLPTVTKFGLLIALLSALGYVVLQRMPPLRTLDALSPAALVFATFLHLGSFFAGTDLGSRTPLSIGNLVPGDEGHHPVALYAAVFTAVGAVASLLVLLRQHRLGLAFGTALTLAATGRFFADEFRPGYLLPQTQVPGFLRVDQLFLIALTAGGMLFFLEWRTAHAK